MQTECSLSCFPHLYIHFDMLETLGMLAERLEQHHTLVSIIHQLKLQIGHLTFSVLCCRTEVVEQMCKLQDILELAQAVVQ